MLFDRFTAAQAGNGQGPPNPQQVQGSPNFQLGNWGNVPPNLAQGMQPFLRGGDPNLGAPQTNGPMAGGAQPGMFGAPAPAGQPSAAGTMPQQQPTPPNMAAGMQPFLGRPAGTMR